VGRAFALIGLVAALACALAAPASASQLVDRNASNVSLTVNKNGLALIKYNAHGISRHVLAWGAINAIPPTQQRSQVKMQLDYSGGWGAFRKPIWKTLKNVCGPYKGPPLAWLVVACTMPDGSNWALQSWQRELPNVGMPAQDWLQSAWELRLSHWNTDIPQLDIHVAWARKRWDFLWGQFTYLGQPIYGYHVTRTGAPLDTFARNIYVDTFNSAYGTGWKRENSFLSHNPNGVFCYGVYPHQANGDRPAGTGQFYRATASGPGVTPDVFWQGPSPGPYNPSLADQAHQLEANLFGTDTICKPK
jgi:hypothetical protein